MMRRADRVYLDTLCLYYEEEIEGEAYFEELAQAFDHADHAAKLSLLADVERHAARAVAPLIAKYRLTPRPAEALQASGRRAARATVPDWWGLLDEMHQSYPGYLADFQALEAMAPPEDRPRLALLTGHETAALEFLALEGPHPERSAAALRAYLDRTVAFGGEADGVAR